ncbi:MAG: cupredoxin domain-containing protein [Nitrospirota bacterium]
MRILKCLIIFLIFTGIAYAEDTASKQKVYTATVDKDGIQRVEITGGEYYFDPSYIIVKKDTPVEFTIRKTSGVIPHNIVIEAPEAGINIRESISTEPKVIRFTPTKTGKYAVYCDKKLLFFKSHKEKGMEGILEVVE